jgi:hypothetical protein
MPNFSAQFCSLLLAVGVVAASPLSEACADSQARRLPRSFSGGSASADFMRLQSLEDLEDADLDSELLDFEEPRARLNPEEVNPAEVVAEEDLTPGTKTRERKFLRRHFSGGSASAPVANVSNKAEATE